MRAFALALVLAIGAVASAEVIQVSHVRASKILALVTGSNAPEARLYRFEMPKVPAPISEGNVLPGRGLIPDGVTEVVADDKAGTIRFEGSMSAKEQLKQVIQMFDVAPRQIQTKVWIESKVDKYSSTTETQIPNNSTWTLEEGTTLIRLTVTPRINGDGSITGYFSVKSGITTTHFIARVKDNERLSLLVSSEGVVKATFPDGMEATWKGNGGILPKPDTNPQTTYVNLAVSFNPVEQVNGGSIQLTSHG